MKPRYTKEEWKMLSPIEQIVNSVFPIEEREKELERLYRKAVNKDE